MRAQISLCHTLPFSWDNCCHEAVKQDLPETPGEPWLAVKSQVTEYCTSQTHPHSSINPNNPRGALCKATMPREHPALLLTGDGLGQATEIQSCPFALAVPHHGAVLADNSLLELVKYPVEVTLRFVFALLSTRELIPN